MELPPVEKGKSDPSLQPWRQLADWEDKGFSWAHGLLVQGITNHMFKKCQLVVVPKSFRVLIMRLAHDQLGHLGHHKVKADH